VTRLAQVVFALLVCATVGGFAIAQRLKAQAPPVRALSTTTDRLFSPNGDGLHDTARISFRLKTRSDAVTLDVIDANGDVVRRLVDDRQLRAGDAQTFVWDGRTETGKVAPDGIYRPRVKLRRQGRTIVLPVEIRLDRTPPRPVVTVLGFGERAGPAIVPEGAATPVDFRFTGPSVGRPSFQVYRTDVSPPRVVASWPGRPGSLAGRWEGRVAGRPAAPGTYLVVARARDAAGNLGAVPQTIRSGRPLRGPLPGRAGITVRSLAVQAPLEPVVTGEPARVTVSAAGRPYRWTLRRIGHSRVLDRGRASATTLRLRVPFGRSGVYLVQVRAAGRTATAPIVVQAATPSKVLVVLPAVTWQGANAVDDDGDGVPNTLGSGEVAHTDRPLAGGLPAGFVDHEGAVMKFLDRAGLRYDLTTDLGLVRGEGPGLIRGRSGVLLAGDTRWLPPTVQAALRGYVERGGRVVSLGTDSLRRTVRLRDDRLSEPSQAGRADAFGSVLAPLRSDRSRLLAFPADRIGLWKGSDGLLSGFTTVETTTGVQAGARLVAGAGPREDRPVVVAVRTGRGYVIRTGLPQWSARLDTDRGANQLTTRMWKLLEGGR
jgi:hypothetical protein